MSPCTSVYTPIVRSASSVMTTAFGVKKNGVYLATIFALSHRTSSNQTLTPTGAPTPGRASCRSDICVDDGNDCCDAGNESTGCSLNGYVVTRVSSPNSTTTCENHYHCCFNSTEKDLYEKDFCSKHYCRSPDRGRGYDCYAGTWAEPCICSKGSARETGATIHFDGLKYYEYTCCMYGSNEGRECGGYSDPFFLSMIIIVPAILVAAVAYCCYYCYKKRKNAPWHHKHGFLRRKTAEQNPTPSLAHTAQRHQYSHCQQQRQQEPYTFGRVLSAPLSSITNNHQNVPSAPPAPKYFKW